MGGARVTTLVTLRKCTLGHKREIKTLKFVSASTKGFKGGLSLDQALQERHGSDFFLLLFLQYTAILYEKGKCAGGRTGFKPSSNAIQVIQVRCLKWLN